MSRTTLIISDTHLGRPGKATAAMLRPVWQGVDELVINGDAAEVQIPWLRAGAVRELEKLEDLTRRDGVRLTLISGNHDAYLTDRRYLELSGGDVLVMHGDALHPAVAPWTRSAKAMHKLTARALADADPDERDTLRTRLAVAQHVGHSEFLEEYVLSSRGEGGVWHAIRRPWEVPRVLAYWRQEPGLALRFIERHTPRTKFLILGHSHRAGVWQRGGRTIINTGAFTFPGRPWCALVSDDTLRVERLVKTRNTFERGGKTVHRAALSAEVSPPNTNTQLPCKTAIA
jgi:predicted phosphodiesterase